MIVLLFFYGISLLNIGIMLSIICMFMTSYREYYIASVKKERELADLRIRMLISQIGPHFIYNSLSTIHYLCTKEPQEAADAVGEFSAFLRNNLDALELKRNIPFENEREHVKVYLALEKRRFGERVKVRFQFTNMRK
ncbi:MAG: histidine kinase [Lachnospiraceae bacterium]|nr:histidine kinase [Lachnospiraceae bacterium]